MSIGPVYYIHFILLRLTFLAVLVCTVRTKPGPSFDVNIRQLGNLCLRPCLLHFVFACLWLFDENVGHQGHPRDYRQGETDPGQKYLALGPGRVFCSFRCDTAGRLQDHPWSPTLIPSGPSRVLPPSTQPGLPATGAKVIFLLVHKRSVQSNNFLGESDLDFTSI